MLLEGWGLRGAVMEAAEAEAEELLGRPFTRGCSLVLAAAVAVPHCKGPATKANSTNASRAAREAIATEASRLIGSDVAGETYAAWLAAETPSACSTPPSSKAPNISPPVAPAARAASLTGATATAPRCERQTRDRTAVFSTASYVQGWAVAGAAARPSRVIEAHQRIKKTEYSFAAGRQ